MKTDYLDAAIRHKQDADLLFDHQRRPNADQLYGFAAECGLKAIMKALGMAIRSDGAPGERHHRVHIEKLWGEFLAFADRSSGAGYAATLPSSNPFADWSVDQRYDSTTSISETAVSKHKNGAEAVFHTLFNAQQDGRL